MLLDQAVVGVIVVKYYLSGMRKTVLTYRDAYGLYWQDRYKPLLEIAVNLIASLVLVMRMGISGVFLGTIISTLTTCFWVEPYVLFRYVFHKKPKQYFKLVVEYGVVTLLVGVLVYALSRFLCMGGALGFIVLCFVCFVMANLAFCIVYFHRWEFQYILRTGYLLFLEGKIQWMRK